MRVLVQRVLESTVRVDGEVVGSVERGFMLLVGFGKDDTEADLEPVARKVANLRVFEDEAGRLQYSILEKEFGVLAVPQFTLYARTQKGRRPDFGDAMAPDIATKLFDRFVERLEQQGIQSVQTGRFGANMQVSLINDGPLTFMLE